MTDNDTLAIASDNLLRVKKSISRRQRGEPSLAARYQTLLNNYLANTECEGENLPLHFLLLYLKGLAEMINNWTCKCTLDEILEGELPEMIKEHLIPDMAVGALNKLQQLHQQAMDAGVVEKPVTGYDEMLCLSSCIGSNCPWRKNGALNSEGNTDKLASNIEAELSEIFNQLEETILVVVELAEQFEQQARPG